jgi:acetyl esterase/lipase
MLELGSLLPAPKDGIVTPISFHVKRRNLRGILAAPDALETGQRELTGEWVTNKRLWRRMTREWTLDGAATVKGRAADGDAKPAGAAKDGIVCLYLHGGAYYMFSAETHRYLTISVSRYCDARVFGESGAQYHLASNSRG